MQSILHWHHRINGSNRIRLVVPDGVYQCRPQCRLLGVRVWSRWLTVLEGDLYESSFQGSVDQIEIIQIIEKEWIRIFRIGKTGPRERWRIPRRKRIVGGIVVGLNVSLESSSLWLSGAFGWTA
jgi:hypothetical protein